MKFTRKDGIFGDHGGNPRKKAANPRRSHEIGGEEATNLVGRPANLVGSYSTTKLSLQHDDNTISGCESWLSLLVFELLLQYFYTLTSSYKVFRAMRILESLHFLMILAVANRSALL